MSPTKILLRKPSSPAEHPLALIRTLPRQARARLATHALPQLMGAMAFQRKLPLLTLLRIFRAPMQTVPCQKTRLPRTTLLLFARKPHILKKPVALSLPLRLVLAQMSAQVKTALRPSTLLQKKRVQWPHPIQRSQLMELVLRSTHPFGLQLLPPSEASSLLDLGAKA